MGFLRRQFATDSSRRQRVFDWIVGVGLFGAVSTLCGLNNLAAGVTLARELFSDSGPSVSVCTLLALVSLAARLILYRSSTCSLLVSGPIFMGAGIAGVMGIFFIPIAVFIVANSHDPFTLMVVALMLSPFLISLVFLRNGVRALRVSSREYGFGPPSVVAALYMAIMLAFIVMSMRNVPPSQTWGDLYWDFDLL